MITFEHLLIKLAALILIFAVGLSGGLIAFGAHKSDRAEVYFSLGSAFAGGIFLGAGLLHMLPDAIGALSGVFAGVEFPLAFLFAGVGFLIILFIEKILFGDVHGLHDAAEALTGKGAAVSAYALAVILSVHSILAGAALGTENTITGSIVIFIAIFAHKGAAGFALITDFQRGGIPRAEGMRVLVLFAAMTPLGILLGAGLDHMLEARSGRLIEGLFDSLAAGTFIYISTMEIIGEEFVGTARLAEKFCLLTAGLALMAVIALWL